MLKRLYIKVLPNYHDSQVDNHEGTTSNDTIDQLDSHIDIYQTEAYRKAVQTYEEEQQKEGAARHTRRMLMKRIG